MTGPLRFPHTVTSNDWALLPSLSDVASLVCVWPVFVLDTCVLYVRWRLVL